MEENRISTENLISSALLERVQALAEVEHRPARDILSEAVALYCEQQIGSVKTANQMPDSTRRTAAQEAGSRIRERRKHRPMPEGMTIRNMIDYGRA